MTESIPLEWTCKIETTRVNDDLLVYDLVVMVNGVTVLKKPTQDPGFGHGEDPTTVVTRVATDLLCRILNRPDPMATYG